VLHSEGYSSIFNPEELSINPIYKAVDNYDVLHPIDLSYAPNKASILTTYYFMNGMIVDVPEVHAIVAARTDVSVPYGNIVMAYLSDEKR